MNTKTLIFTTFIFFSFPVIQVIASNCELKCLIQESVKSQSTTHNCCQKEAEKKNKSSSCANKLFSSCLHEFASQSSELESFCTISLKTIFLEELSILGLNNTFNKTSEKRVNFPDKDFHKYKSNISLYLLKNQFLI